MTQMSRRHFARLPLALGAAALPWRSWAGGYPQRPVRCVVPYSAGGGADLVARMLAQRLTESLGWNVVVDNRPGANGMIGSDVVAKSAPDGHTLLLADTAHATNAALQPRLPFDPVKDFAPITLVGSSPQLLVAHPSFPANSLQEMLALPRAKVQGAGVGTTGQGSVAHLLCEMLKLKTGMDLVHVPYKGGSAALGDAAAGQIPLAINAMPACMPHVEARRLKVLAIASPARSPRLPQVQTVAETVPGLVGSAWYGLLAPARTPQDVQHELGAAVAAALEQPEIKAKLAGAYIDPLPGGPAAFAQFLAEDIARWQAVVRQTGISLNS
ncbi:tripartite tricarboxylate transporter substrate binding protein [uncultured Pseudacidovorax sp.]|uniref:tripartite tricarboxylate transporter substrate binding protein n=1 Tax=uncultured Pseudacidovorax sp. TaxID=679313 RepID=UPI0025E76050|nr:tripartite tricarboxylate transporter substrate binding protein [uncultured Pseudacidovorax sp.]